MKNKRTKKIMLKNFSLILCILLMACLVCACGAKKTGDMVEDDASVIKYGQGKKESNVDNSIDDIKSETTQDISECIEEKYGISDGTVYAEHISHITREPGVVNTSYETKLKEGSKVGSVFYKTVTPEDKSHGLVCIFLSFDEDRGISLKAETSYFRNDSDSIASSSTFSISSITSVIKERNYAIVGDEYLVCVCQTENAQASSIYEDEKVYEEKITVYKLTEGAIEDIYTISRTMNSEGSQTKEFEIKSDSEWCMYVSGYSSYTAEGVEFITTQEEFCRKANEILQNCSVDCIRLNKTSWNNRWFGTDIDENGINDTMVKVDYIYSEPVQLENGDEVADVVIKINDEKQQLAEGEMLEEIYDEPSYCGQNSETELPQEPVVMPDYIPQFVDVNDLQDLQNFNIDGFWYSADNRYVYRIYTEDNNPFASLSYVDLDGACDSKNGHVIQTSTYSVHLKANEDRGFSPEVCAVNNQLVSDEITLIRIDDFIPNSLVGTWANNGNTYTFESDGTYKLKKSSSTDWGKYYFLGENQIALGIHGKDLKVYDFSNDGNAITLNGITYIRQ